jgi:phosphonate transport system substrate-binding protein
LGKFDAGALKESTFKRLVKKGEPLRSIASFPNVTKPWVASSGLEPEIRQALRRTLLDLKDPNVLKALKKDGFLPGSDEDYAMIRGAIQNSKKFFQQPQS